MGLAVWAVVVHQTKLLLGTRGGPLPSAALDASSRLAFLLCLYTPLIGVSTGLMRWLLTALLPLYALSYLDRGEATGARISLRARYDIPGPIARAYAGALGFGQQPSDVSWRTARRSAPRAATSSGFTRTASFLSGRRAIWAPLSRASTRAFLASRTGLSVAIFLGGAAESYLTDVRNADLVLRRRLGFIRLALEHGVPVVPVYTFGENDLGVRAIPGNFGVVSRLWMRTTGIALPFLWPSRRSGPVVTVIGQPVQLRAGAGGGSYTAADVEQLHKMYVDALNALYERHVGAYGSPEAPARLSFVE